MPDSTTSPRAALGRPARASCVLLLCALTLLGAAPGHAQGDAMNGLAVTAACHRDTSPIARAFNERVCTYRVGTRDAITIEGGGLGSVFAAWYISGPEVTADGYWVKVGVGCGCVIVHDGMLTFVFISSRSGMVYDSLERMQARQDADAQALRHAGAW